MDKIFIFGGVVSIDHYTLSVDEIKAAFPALDIPADAVAVTYDRKHKMFLEATEVGQRQHLDAEFLQQLEGVRAKAIKGGVKEADLEPLPASLAFPNAVYEDILDTLLVNLPDLEDPDVSESEQQVELFGVVESTKSNITGNPGKCKLSGWITKEQRANRIKAGVGTAADDKIVLIEATRRGLNESPEQLVDLQLAKANGLGEIVAFLDALESDYIKSVKGRKIKRKDFKAIIQSMNDEIVAFLISQGLA